MSKPVLGYWKIRGLAQPIRNMLAYIGTDYEDKWYESREAWFDQDKPNLGLDFPNIPYWIEGDIRMSESKAIIQYIAGVKGASKKLLPDTPEMKRKGDMVESFVWDTIFALIRTCWSWTEELQATLKDAAPKRLCQLAKFLGANKFVLGDRVTYVDFIFYEMLYFFTKFDASYLQPHPNLEAYIATFEAIPEIAAYMASPSYIAAPCIAPIAKYAF